MDIILGYADKQNFDLEILVRIKRRRKHNSNRQHAQKLRRDIREGG